MSILINILIISLFCNGWYLICDRGMVLFPIHQAYLSIYSDIHPDKIIHRVLAFLYKPLFGCVTCMASIWGSLVYWTISDNLILWPITIIGAACGNILINSIYEK
jgi:hypothetical protein